MSNRIIVSVSNEHKEAVAKSGRIATAVLLLLITRFLWAQPTATFVQAGPSNLSNPHDLKLSPDNRYLFVSDVGNNRVAILDPETRALVGTFGDDLQSGAHDIDFDAMGRAVVAGAWSNNLLVYNDGVVIDELGGLSEYWRNFQASLLVA